MKQLCRKRGKCVKNEGDVNNYDVDMNVEVIIFLHIFILASQNKSKFTTHNTIFVCFTSKNDAERKYLFYSILSGFPLCIRRVRELRIYII